LHKHVRWAYGACGAEDLPLELNSWIAGWEVAVVKVCSGGWLLSNRQGQHFDGLPRHGRNDHGGREASALHIGLSFARNTVTAGKRQIQKPLAISSAEAKL
jgi:hypothetical protein